MRKLFLFAITVMFFSISCKKNNDSIKEGLLSSIKFYNTPNTFNVTYQLYYNAEKKLERISYKGSTPGGTVNVHYFMEYVAGKLDSIIEFDSTSNTRWDAVGADWTENKMTFFWRSTHIYDTENRIINSTTISGNITRYEYLTDSSIAYFDPVGSDPEYKLWVTYRTSNTKNPFRIKGNETLFPINNFVFSLVNNQIFNGGFELAESRNTYYKPDGTLQYIQNAAYEGNVNGYPTKVTISNDRSPEIRVFEFTYQ